MSQDDSTKRRRNSWEHAVFSTPTRATVCEQDQTTTGTVVRAVSQNLDARVTIEFGLDAAPDLAVGRAVETRFYGGAIGCGVDAKGCVVSRSDAHRGIEYDLLYTRAANRALSPLVNRRDALRVRPALESEALVVLRPEGGNVQIERAIYDVSATGLAILIEKPFEASLASVRSVELVLRLPGLELLKPIRAAIVRRELIGEQVLYGIRFDERDQASQSEALLQWVLAAHRSELANRIARSAG